MNRNISQTSSSSIKVTYVPEAVGVYVIHLRNRDGTVMEYPVNVCNPKSIKIARGFDLKAKEFVPRLVQGEDSQVMLYIGEAGPGKVEAELANPNSGKIRVDVASNDDT